MSIGPISYVLLDRSLSMQGKWNDVLASVNAYVSKLRESAPLSLVRVFAFDHHNNSTQFECLRGSRVYDYADIDGKDVMPRGGTPLIDAVARLCVIAEDEAPHRAAIVIMTDGEENASSEVKLEDVKAKLDKCRKRGWEVLFLGASFDNIRQGSMFGNASNKTVYGSGRDGTRSMTMSTANSVAEYYSSGKSVEVDEALRKAWAENKAT